MKLIASLLIILLAFTIALAFPTSPVQAATITLTTTDPRINDGDGQCSLIEAIENANVNAATHPDCPAGSGADVINIPAGTYTLITPYNSTTDKHNGLPPIIDDLTLQGESAKTTIIERDANTWDFRLVESRAHLTVNDLTLQNGNMNASSCECGRGDSAILSSSPGRRLTVNRSSFVNNTGAAIYSKNFVEINHSQFTDGNANKHHEITSALFQGGGIGNYQQHLVC